MLPHACVTADGGSVSTSAGIAAAGALDELVRMLSAEVLQQLRAEEEARASTHAERGEQDGVPVAEDGGDGPASAAALASRVLAAVRTWPRKQRHFHRIQALAHEPQPQTDRDSRQSLDAMISRIRQVQDPSAAAAAAAASSAGAPAPAAVPALPPSAGVSSFHSLFSPFPSQDSIASSCAALLLPPQPGGPTHLSLLDSLLAVSYTDLVASPQWDALLQAIGTCAGMGRTWTQAPAPLALEVPIPPQPAARSKKKNQTPASRKGAAVKGAAAKLSVPSPTRAAAPAPAPATSPIDAFLLASRGSTALGELYTAAEGSSQTAEVYLALLETMQETMKHAAASTDTSAVAMQWMASLPSDATTLSQLHSAASTPSVLFHTLLFHQSRLLGHMAHSLPDCWLHFNDDLQFDIVSRTLDLLASALLHSPHPSANPVWVSLVAPDVRFLWLRRWMSQQGARRHWHEAARQNTRWPLVQERMWSGAQQHVVACVQSAPSPTTASSSHSQPHPLLLSLTDAEVDALGCASVAIFMMEHVSSWVAAVPPSHLHATASSAASPARDKSAVSAAVRQNEKHSEADELQQPLAEMAVRMLSHAALTFKRPAHDAHESQSSTALSSPPPLVIRCRLTLLSSCQHYLSEMLPRPSFAGSAMSLLSQLLLSYLALLDSRVAVEPFDPAHAQEEAHQRGQAGAGRKDSEAESGKSRSRNASHAGEQEPHNVGAALCLVQHAALTSIIGLCLTFVRHSATHRARLVKDLRVPMSTPVAAGTSEYDLLQLLCRVLDLDSSGAPSPSADSARVRVAFSASPLLVPATPSAHRVLYLPSVLERMLLELLRECIPPPTMAKGSRGDASQAESQMCFVRNLASRCLEQMDALSPELAAPSGPEAETIIPHFLAGPSSQDASPPPTALAHQQFASLTLFLDLLSHWACSLDCWSSLAETHPRVIDVACRRFLLLLCTRTPESTCLPWCRRCWVDVAAAAQSSAPGLLSHSSMSPLPPVLLRTLDPQLRSLVRCATAFRHLARMGLVHFLVSQLCFRLQEDEQWTLAFELDEEDNEPQESAIDTNMGVPLWSLRMLIVSLGNAACLRVMEEEESLLTSTPASEDAPFISRALSVLPTAPRPPLLLLLAHVLHAWLGPAGAAQDDQRVQASPPSSSLLHPPIRIPLSLPLPAAPVPAASAVASPLLAAWFRPLPCVYASPSDARQVCVRLLCGLLQLEPALTPALWRWFDIATWSGLQSREEDGENAKQQATAHTQPDSERQLDALLAASHAAR